MTTILGSASTILYYLKEQDKYLVLKALEKLNAPGVVELYWSEIADYLGEIEFYQSDETFDGRELASLVAAKVYYHLDLLADASHFALGAGDLLDITDTSSQFVSAVLNNLIDQYIKSRGSLCGGRVPLPDANEKVEEIVEKLIKNSMKNGNEIFGFGTALECGRIDLVEQILQVQDIESFKGCLEFILKNLGLLGSTKERRECIAKTLESAFVRFFTVSFDEKKRLHQLIVSLCIQSHSVDTMVDILLHLIHLSSPVHSSPLGTPSTPGAREEEVDALLYQIAFHIALSECTPFIQAIREHPSLSSPTPPLPTSPLLSLSSLSPLAPKRLQQVHSILSKEEITRLNLQMLSKKNKTDLSILDKILQHDSSSITHNGLVIAHAFSQAGTSNDSFLRVNLDWLAKAFCWAKYTATASLGVIHQGQTLHATKILSKYLPPPLPNLPSLPALPPAPAAPTKRSPYAEAGAFYALGLLFSSSRDTTLAQEIRNYLLQELSRHSSSEIHQHGISLSLSLLSLGLSSPSLYEPLKTVLYTDSAIAGEAAALSIGIVYLGSNDKKKIQEILLYAKETQHEKIARAASLSIALLVAQAQDKALESISLLLSEKDSVLRYGGVFALGLAYCGTADPSAQKKLLDISVSDVSEEVKRAAMMALGFLLSGSVDLALDVFSLAADSYSPQVRYGVAWGLGISCAGSGRREVVEILKVLLKDAVDFVRQGAAIALGLVLMNTAGEERRSEEKKSEEKKSEEKKADGEKKTEGEKEKEKEKAEEKREGRAEIGEMLLEMSCDKRLSGIARLGCSVGLGLMEAGGRNVTCGLLSGEGMVRDSALVGFLLACQFWYWYPYLLCLSLGMRSSLMVGVTRDMKVPEAWEWKIHSSVFDYPPERKKEEIKVGKKVETAVLSRTKKEGEKKEGEKKEEEGEKVEEKKEGEEKEKKKQAFIVSNPVRVCKGQSEYMTCMGNGRFQSIIPSYKGNFVLLLDQHPEEPFNRVDFDPQTAVPTSEPAVPPEFEWDGSY